MGRHGDDWRREQNSYEHSMDVKCRFREISFNSLPFTLGILTLPLILISLGIAVLIPIGMTDMFIGHVPFVYCQMVLHTSNAITEIDKWAVYK